VDDAGAVFMPRVLEGVIVTQPVVACLQYKVSGASVLGMFG